METSSKLVGHEGVHAAEDSGVKSPILDGGGNQIVSDLSRLWQRALQYRMWLLGLVAGAITVAVIFTMLQTPYYRSTAQIEINRVDAGASQSIDPRTSMGEERDLQYYNTQYELLGTRAVAERVVDELNLSRYPAFNDAYAASERDISAETATNILLSGIAITPIQRSNLVDISFSSPDPALSATIANTWAEQFLELNYEKRFGDTILARNQLNEQLAEMRVQLEESEARLNNYASENQIIVLQGSSEAGDTTRSTILASQLEAMNTALAEASIRRIAAQAALQSDNAARGNQRSTILQRISETEAELANLRTTLGPNHPDILAHEAELRSLQDSLQNDGADAIQERRAAYEEALAAEEELRQRYETAKSQYLGQQGQGVAYGILEREVDTNRQIYDALLQRYNQLGVSGTGTNNMALVEEARPASAPYSPSMPANIGIAVVVALVLSAALVYLGDLFDQTVRDPDTVTREFGLPLLGLIPQTEEGQLVDDLHDKHSSLSEAYASARVALQVLSERQKLASIMLTSTRPAEGKSISSVAIAKSFAEVGDRVVLIDLDLRRRGASRFLEMPAGDIGIERYLAGSKEAPTLRTRDDFGFDFLGSKNSATNPVTLLASPKLPALLRELEEKYDRVIVDGPPVLGLADAIEISRMMDGVLYVVEANSGPTRSIRLALSRLRGASANLIGGMMTKLDERNAAYGYGYGYGYGYSYANDPKDPANA